MPRHVGDQLRMVPMLEPGRMHIEGHLADLAQQYVLDFDDIAILRENIADKTLTKL